MDGLRSPNWLRTTLEVLALWTEPPLCPSVGSFLALCRALFCVVLSSPHRSNGPHAVSLLVVTRCRTVMLTASTGSRSLSCCKPLLSNTQGPKGSPSSCSKAWAGTSSSSLHTAHREYEWASVIKPHVTTPPHDTCVAVCRGSVFSFVINVLGAAAFIVGTAALWSNGLIFQLFAQHVAWLFMGIGLTLVLVSLLGCSGAGFHVAGASCFLRPCCLFRCSRRRSLLLMTVFTCVVGAALVGCLWTLLVYEEELAAAGAENETSAMRNSTAAQPDGHWSRALSSLGKQVLKGAFLRGYNACRPTVYNSTMINDADYCGGNSTAATTTTITTTTTTNSTTSTTTTTTTTHVQEGTSKRALSQPTTVDYGSGELSQPTTAADAEVDYAKYCGRPSQVGVGKEVIV